MNCYIEMLQKCIKKIEADFDFSAIIDHNGSKGTFREYIVKQFLRPFLPLEYGISGGQAFDENGNISKQLDIVIYDALHSYIAPYTDDFIYFPCESVYGSIEIKSKLNKNSFMESVRNIESFKKLYRQPIDTYYVNPAKALKISNINWNIQATNEYFGVIFAYESLKSETILSYIEEIINDDKSKKEYLPNVIVLLKDQKIISRFHKCDDGMFAKHPLKHFDGFIVEECGENVLAEFIVLLFVMLRSIELKAMDIEEFSKKVHKLVFTNNKKDIEQIWLN